MLRDEVAQLVEEQKTKLNEGTVKIVKEIYDEIYCKFREQYIVIFLCGGASTSKHKSLRDRVRVLLENEKRHFGINHTKYSIQRIC